MDHTTIVAPSQPRTSTPTGGGHSPGAGGGRASGGGMAPCDEAGAIRVRGVATGEPGQPRDIGDLAVSGAVEAVGPSHPGSIERPYERRREDRP